MVNWEAMLANKNVHEQVNTSDKVSKSFFSYFTPSKTVTFDDKDPPSFPLR